MPALTDADKVLRNDTGKDIANKLNAIADAIAQGGGGGSSTLAGLNDVNLTSPSNEQVLKYNSTTGKWENADESGGSGGSTVVFVVTASHPANPTVYSIVVQAKGTTVFSKDYSCTVYGEFAETTDTFIYRDSTYTVVAQGYQATSGNKMLDFSIDDQSVSVNCSHTNSSYAASDEFNILIEKSLNASSVDYDNTSSGLEADNVQDAIDEVKEITDNLDDKLDGLTNIISTASGSIATFNDGGDNIPVKSLITDITAIQAGTGTPSPDNIRAITGFDEIVVSVIGKNFYPIKVGRDLFADNRGASHTTNDDTLSITMTSENNSGAYGGTGTAVNNVICQTIKKYSGEFVLSLYAKASADNKNVYFGFGSFGYVIESLTTEWKRIELPLTLDGEIHTLTFYNRSSTAITVDIKDLQIELGTTTTDYSEYDSNSTTHSITLPETIYGANANLTDGAGEKTLDCVDLGDLSWTMGSAHIGFYANLPNAISPISSGDINAICSCYERTDSPSTTVGLPNLTFCISDGNITTQKRVFIRDDSYNGDANAFKTGVTGQKLVYTLETPTSFSFTPESIRTSSGFNNIYSNTGDVEVEYFNSKADWLADLIKAMSAT